MQYHIQDHVQANGVQVLSGRWDNKPTREPSNKFYYAIYGFGAGFITGFIYTLFILLN